MSKIQMLQDIRMSIKERMKRSGEEIKREYPGHYRVPSDYYHNCWQLGKVSVAILNEMAKDDDSLKYFPVDFERKRKTVVTLNDGTKKLTDERAVVACRHTKLYTAIDGSIHRHYTDSEWEDHLKLCEWYHPVDRNGLYNDILACAFYSQVTYLCRYLPGNSQEWNYIMEYDKYRQRITVELESETNRIINTGRLLGYPERILNGIVIPAGKENWEHIFLFQERVNRKLAYTVMKQYFTESGVWS